MGPNGSVVDSNGTSFAAPFVSATLATLNHRLDVMVPRETLLALRIHRAKRCRDMRHKALKHVAREFVGSAERRHRPLPRRRSAFDYAGGSPETLMAKRELEFVFSWPRPLVLGNGKCCGCAERTLVYTPPIDANFNVERLRVQL